MSDMFFISRGRSVEYFINLNKCREPSLHVGFVFITSPTVAYMYTLNIRATSGIRDSEGFGMEI